MKQKTYIAQMGSDELAAQIISEATTQTNEMLGFVTALVLPILSIFALISVLRFLYNHLSQ